MALKGSAKLVSDHTEQRHYYGILGTLFFKNDKVRRYEWACDEDGSATTATALYGTGGFSLTDFGCEIGRDKARGIYFETYKSFGTWTS